MEVDGREWVQHDIVEELEIESPLEISYVLWEDYVKCGCYDHVDGDEDHQGVEVAGAPVQGEQHEGQQASYDL